MKKSTSENQEKQKEEHEIKKVTVFIIVAMALLMSTVDATIVATALNTLQRELDASITWTGWTLTAYALGFAVMLPLSAKLGYRFGERKVFLFSIIVFTGASILCGMVNNIFLLLFFRFIQALGGAGITPSVTGLIVQHFGSSRDRAVSLFGSIFPLGGLLGPVFGGLIVTYLSWRWIFFVNIPFGILVILGALKFIPKDDLSKKRRDTDPDIKGIVFMGVSILSGMLAATYIGEEGSSLLSIPFLILSALMLISAVLFFRHISTVKNPFIRPKYIYGKYFGAVNYINIIYGGVTIGVISLVPLFAATQYEISDLGSGTLLAFQGIAAIVMSMVMTLLIRRTGYKLPLYIGSSFILIGVLLMGFHPFFGLSPYSWLAFSCFLIGFGMGTNSPPGRNAGLQLAPQQSGTLAAIRSLGIQLGAILTISVATAIISHAPDAGNAHLVIHFGAAAILFLALPIISGVPEHKGSW